MNYEQFYKEVADWINQSNQMAIQYGLQSNDFWSWVMQSTGELCNKYNNNELVKRQVIMLVDWLKDIYEKGKQ